MSQKIKTSNSGSKAWDRAWYIALFSPIAAMLIPSPLIAIGITLDNGIFDPIIILFTTAIMLFFLLYIYMQEPKGYRKFISIAMVVLSLIFSAFLSFFVFAITFGTGGW